MECGADVLSLKIAGTAGRIRLLLLTITIMGVSAAVSACHSPTKPTPSVTLVSVGGNAPAVGSTTQMTATASFSDGTTQNVTSQAAWNSTNAGIASVNLAGVVTGVSAGPVNITAIYQSISGTIALTVTPGATPPPQCTYSLSVGSTINGNATGGTFSVFVSTGGGCPWSATSTATWLHVSGSSTGSGNVTIIEDANTTGSARFGTVSVASQTITFNQPPQASSTAVTLTYTGHTFSTVFGNYKTSDKVTGTVVLSAPLAKNLSSSSCVKVGTNGSLDIDSNVSASLVSWSFSDGHQTINSSTSGDFFEVACFFTNASGTITGWRWLVAPQNGTTKADIQTFDSEDFAQDATGSNGGQSNTTGQWAVSSSTTAPQGAIFPMILEGLGLVLVLAVIRRSHSASRISRWNLTVPSSIGDSAMSPLAIWATTAAVHGNVRK